MCYINKFVGIPLYCQLMRFIISEIGCNKLKENDKLPSERELSEKYKISRDTVRQAIAQLEKMGYVYKIHGKGCFVASSPLSKHMYKFSDFTYEMKKIGKELVSKLIKIELIPADKDLISILNVSKESMIYKIVRIRMIDSVPLIFERTYLSSNCFDQKYTEEMIKSSLYSVLKKNYSINFTKSEETFFPVIPDREIAGHLNIMEFQPLVKIERLSYTDNHPVVFTERFVRGDKFRYSITTDY